jgi:hypothetical protein
LIYRNVPPEAPREAPYPPEPPPPPTTTAEILVTPDGATQEKVPAVVYASCPVTGSTGVTLLLAALGTLLPNAFVAITVNVYAVPLVSPLTVTGDVAPVPVKPPGFDVTV